MDFSICLGKVARCSLHMEERDSPRSRRKSTNAVLKTRDINPKIVFIGNTWSLYLQYQFGAPVPSIVDQARRRATFILSFEEPLQHSRSPPLSGWSRPSIRPMNLYECSGPTLFHVSYSLFDFSRSLSPSLFVPFLSLSICFPSDPASLGDRNGRASFRIPSSFPTPMLVCSLVKRNGQAVSVAPLRIYGISAAGLDPVAAVTEV